MPLALGVFALGVLGPLAGLLLGGRSTRFLALCLILSTALAVVGWLSAGNPTALVLGVLLGVGFAVIGRTIAWISGTPLGVALVGAFWGTFLNPCACGWCGPLFMLFAMQNDPKASKDEGTLLFVSTAYGLLYLLFAAVGAVVNVLIYRWRRRKLWEASGYVSTLRRRTEGPADEPTRSQ